MVPENGPFRNRKQLLKVSGLGPKAFEQAVGFLRIRDGENPLDCTAVHPESYPVVEQIAEKLGTPIAELIQSPQLLTKIDAKTIAAGSFTVADILEELKKPGRDPRDTFVAPSFVRVMEQNRVDASAQYLRSIWSAQRS